MECEEERWSVSASMSVRRRDGTYGVGAHLVELEFEDGHVGLEQLQLLLLELDDAVALDELLLGAGAAQVNRHRGESSRPLRGG